MGPTLPRNVDFLWTSWFFAFSLGPATFAAEPRGFPRLSLDPANLASDPVVFRVFPRTRASPGSDASHVTLLHRTSRFFAFSHGPATFGYGPRGFSRFSSDPAYLALVRGYLRFPSDPSK